MLLAAQSSEMISPHYNPMQERWVREWEEGGGAQGAAHRS
jgi:hypothetical protein